MGRIIPELGMKGSASTGARIRCAAPPAVTGASLRSSQEGPSPEGTSLAGPFAPTGAVPGAKRFLREEDLLHALKLALVAALLAAFLTALAKELFFPLTYSFLEHPNLLKIHRLGYYSPPGSSRAPFL